VQTQFGWHIIKVEERRTHPLPTFDQVKDTIMSQLSEQKANQKLKELHEAAKIEIIDPDIKKSMDAAAAKNLVPSDQPEQGSESGIPPG
jgi:peptidyl-prolyl cis-trans isomerase C